MMKKVSSLLPSFIFDIELGADAQDLDNYTYFSTLDELNSPREDW